MLKKRFERILENNPLNPGSHLSTDWEKNQNLKALR